MDSFKKYVQKHSSNAIKSLWATFRIYNLIKILHLNKRADEHCSVGEAYGVSKFFYHNAI